MTDEQESYLDFYVNMGWGGEKLADAGRAALAEIKRLRAELEIQGDRLLWMTIALGVCQGSIDMACDRLGGLVEGRPPHRANFLQRIDELVAKEAVSRPPAALVWIGSQDGGRWEAYEDRAAAMTRAREDFDKEVGVTVFTVAEWEWCLKKGR